MNFQNELKFCWIASHTHQFVIIIMVAFVVIQWMCSNAHQYKKAFFLVITRYKVAVSFIVEFKKRKLETFSNEQSLITYCFYSFFIFSTKINLQVVQPLSTAPDIVLNDIRSTISARELTCSTEPYCLREKTPRREMSSLADELKQYQNDFSINGTN